MDSYFIHLKAFLSFYYYKCTDSRSEVQVLVSEEKLNNLITEKRFN